MEADSAPAAWLLEPTDTLRNAQEAARQLLAGDVRLEGGEYAVCPPVSPRAALGFMGRSRVVEFVVTLQGDPAEAAECAVPAYADMIVGASAPVGLRYGTTLVGDIAADRRHRFPLMHGTAVVRVPPEGVTLRLRLEPRGPLLGRGTFANALGEEYDWDWDTQLVTPSAGRFAADWPPLSRASCDLGAVWLLEPTCTLGDLRSLLCAQFPRHLPSAECDPELGGYLVRGLPADSDQTETYLRVSRAFEYCARVRLDSRGVGLVGAGRRYLVAVSGEVELRQGLGADAVSLGRYVPGERYRVPLRLRTPLHLRGTPNSKLLVRLRAELGDPDPYTFADGAGREYGYWHGFTTRS